MSVTSLTVSARSISNEVKLVIWDLDDTFWKGTLSEEPVEAIADNIELVKLLTDRAIICSICSKNERAAVEAELRKMGVWDAFVLPSISFQAKGRSIPDIVEALQLRPVNVVFIDDNPTVLAEVAFTCPGIQRLDAPSALRAQLDSPFLRGNPGAGARRLAQYQMLAAKHEERQAHGAHDEAFLRQSGIRIEIDYAVEPHIDRIIELINRSNQLNYTKVRIKDEAERKAFIESLTKFGVKPGVVRVWDKYGDYGIVGFFMTLATLREYRLEHFVFSCRLMNMGVEQYVYEYLNRPAIDIAHAVANGLDAYPVVDWIETGLSADVVASLRDFRLVVIGGCDMLQLSTYCSSTSTEFTNREFRGIIKRLDDPFLIIDDPEAVRNSPLREHVPAFTHAEMLELNRAVGEADAVVASFYRMMEINYFRGRDGLIVRFDEDAVKQILASDQALWFVRSYAYVEFSHEERQALIQRSLQRLCDLSPDGCKVIALLENTRKLENYPGETHLRSPERRARLYGQ